MAYSTSLPGIRESSLDTLLALMTAKLSDLNTAITGISPSLPLNFTLSANQFYIGDPDTLPDVATNPFWVSLVGGGKQDGRDQSFELKSQQGGYWRSIYTNIYFYLHPDALPGTSVITQATARERLRARFIDWLTDDVFCVTGTGSLQITLGSRVYAVSPNYDTIDRSYIRDITMGYVMKSYGSTQWVYMAHALHEGEIYAG